MNAFWDRWRKPINHPSKSSKSDNGGLSPYLVNQIRQTLATVARPCASMSVGGAATEPTQSFLTGHPYLPAGQNWPEGDHGPQFFVGQFNFAEIADLPGFPDSGLLQWFVDTNHAYGLTFDDTQGAVGFTARWYPDVSMPSVAAPDEPTPTEHVDEVPMEFVGPTAITFEPAESVPAWQELPAGVQRDPVWEQVALAIGENRSELGYVYNEYIRGDGSRIVDYEFGSKIGGFPSFTQEDPRGEGSYPSLGSPASALLIELDSLDVGGWGDSGIAHLFGDPGALARQDTSGIRYHWDCM